MRSTSRLFGKLNTVYFSSFSSRPLSCCSLKSRYIGETEKPVCPIDGLLIKVKAAGINRADIIQRMGKYPPPSGESSILGLEASGIVEEVGEKVPSDEWKIGDRVMTLLGGDVAIHYQMAIPIPSSLSFVQAAAIPEAFLTAYQNLFLVGSVKQGDVALLHAGASGVGTAAIQILRLTGVKTYVTVGSDEKVDACVALGASSGANRREGRWKHQLTEWLASEGLSGVDYILDPVGQDYFLDDLEVLNRDGTLCMIGFLSGSQLNDQSVNLSPILAKRLSIKGSTLRTRTLDYKIMLTQQFASSPTMQALENGQVKAIVDKEIDWQDVALAHDHMQQNRNVGKIIITGM